MNCAEVKEQLVDFLYGELSANARAAFAEHLRACPGCSAEVASHEKVLGQARAVLQGPLAQEVPARVRTAVLAAAQAAAAKPNRTNAPASEELGFFARLWRTPWLLPAFGAASVATAVFLVRVLKNPEVLPAHKALPTEEPVLVAPAVAPSPRPSTAEPDFAAASPSEALKGGPKGETKAKAHRGLAKPASQAPLDREGVGSLGLAAGKAAPSAGGKRRALVDDPLSGIADGAGAPTANGAGTFAVPPPPRQAPRRNRDLDMLESFDRAEHKAPSGPPPSSAVLDQPMHAQRRYAAPPPAPAAKAEAAMEMPRPMPDKSRSEDQADDKETKKKDETPPSPDASIRKADRLFASADWSGAAEAYRELLRRYPNHKDATKWRERMNQSLLAVEEARKAGDTNAAKASKAVKGEVETMPSRALEMK